MPASGILFHGSTTLRALAGILALAAIFVKNLPLGKESMVKIKDKQIPEGGRAGAPTGVLAFRMSQVDMDGTIGVFGTQQDNFVH